MYKYFKELDNPNGFMTLCNNDNLPKIVSLYQFNLRDLPIEVLENLRHILTNIPTIDFLASQLQFIFISYENQVIYGDFLNYQGDNSLVLKMLKEKVNITNNDLLDLLNIYQNYISFLIPLYPEHKDYLNGLNKRIKKVIKFMESKCWIEIPVKPLEQVIWPNNWFITPNGYLYNACTGGKKSGSLFWTLYNIFETLKENKNVIEKFEEYITKLNLVIRDIESGEFVTFEQFYYYTDFTRFPFSQTPELQFLNCSTVYNLVNNTIENITGICYQKNIKTIVLGYLNAQLVLYKYYLYLYKQISYSPNYHNLIGYLKQSESDILLKFCGFHRIDPSLERTIITSSFDNLSDFSSYEENGWTIKVIPSIKYDKEEDAFIEGDLNTSKDKKKYVFLKTQQPEKLKGI